MKLKNLILLTLVLESTLFAYDKKIINTTNQTVKVQSKVSFNGPEERIMPPKSSDTLRSWGGLCFDYVAAALTSNPDDKESRNAVCNGDTICIGYEEKNGGVDKSRVTFYIPNGDITGDNCKETIKFGAPRGAA